LALFEERSAIARELHDSLAQSLSYLKIQVTRLSSLRKSGAGDDKIEDVEANLSEGLNLAYQELRKLLKTFRLQMDERGLALTLAEEITEINARSGINIQLNYQFNTSPFTVSEEIHVLYIVREALANVEKHSGAKHAMVRVCSSKDESIRVSIEDDGGGFKLPETEMGHYGMTIMQERAHSLNGTLEVGATSTGGICVDLTFFPKKISTRKDTIQEI
jgi:two-component system nitrate/nitrite sensor histidine kinase NarX